VHVDIMLVHVDMVLAQRVNLQGLGIRIHLGQRSIDDACKHKQLTSLANICRLTG
jgi:hypothetical protein